MAPILTVQDLGISFGNNHVLKSVNYTLDENEILGVIGPNGAGKTVMLNILTGILKPTKGKVIFNGEDITYRSVNDREPFYRLVLVVEARVRAVFQRSRHVGDKQVEQALEAGAELEGGRADRHDAAVSDTLL